MSDLWNEASRDIEVESANRKLTAARVIASPVWAFLSTATTAIDYENRKALIEDRFEAAVKEAIDSPVCDANLYSELVASFDEDYRLLASTRMVASKYCETHDVWVGEGNAANHDDTCKMREGKNKDASKTAGVPVCSQCGHQVEKDSFDGSWRHKSINHAYDNDHKPTVASKTAGGLDNIPEEKKAEPFGKGDADSDSDDKDKSDSDDSPKSDADDNSDDKGDSKPPWLDDDKDEDKKESALEAESGIGDVVDRWGNATPKDTLHGIEHGLKNIYEDTFGNPMWDVNEDGTKKKSSTEEDESSRLPFDHSASVEGGEGKTAADEGFTGKTFEDSDGDQCTVGEYKPEYDKYVIHYPAGKDGQSNDGLMPTEMVRKRVTSMHKGAPFAGYEDFDACVAANQDKSNPEAYCGSIKHKVEDDKKESTYRPSGGQAIGDHYLSVEQQKDGSFRWQLSPQGSTDSANIKQGNEPTWDEAWAAGESVALGKTSHKVLSVDDIVSLAYSHVETTLPSSLETKEATNPYAPGAANPYTPTQAEPAFGDEQMGEYDDGAQPSDMMSTTPMTTKPRQMPSAPSQPVSPPVDPSVPRSDVPIQNAPSNTAAGSLNASQEVEEGVAP